eukprot:3362963-Pyramimonas_sp.AAC.1
MGSTERPDQPIRSALTEPVEAEVGQAANGCKEKNVSHVDAVTTTVGEPTGQASPAVRRSAEI